MTREEYERANSRIKRRTAEKWAVRIIVGFVGLTAITLMGCGCLYIRDAIVRAGQEEGKDLPVYSGTINNGLQSDQSGIAENVGSENLIVQNPGDGKVDGEAAQNPEKEPDEKKEEPKDKPKEEPKDETQENGKKDDDVFSVVIDPGHGSNDGGTYYGDVIEKNINLAVGLLMRDKLEAQDVKVIMTRDTDVWVDLEDRPKISNESGADLFVSVHCNFYEGKETVRGLEVYHHEDSKEGGKLAEAISAAVNADKDIKCRGVRQADFVVIKHNKLPAVLVEMGFISDATEREKLNSADYQDKLASDMVEGIMNYLNGK